MRGGGFFVKRICRLEVYRPPTHDPRAELGGCLRSSIVGLVIGTRPEAIKLAPVALALEQRGLAPWILKTGQHPGLDLREHRLGHLPATPLDCPGQVQPHLHVDVVSDALQRCWQSRRPDLVLVQGDTSSALGGARAAAAAGIALGHVEAGLRTHDIRAPWPEEIYRVEIDRLADLLFAPNEANAANLREERVGGRLFVTGNPGIDALLARPTSLTIPRWLRRPRPLLLVTCHRRESWGEGLERVAAALRAVGASRRARIEFVLHPNPSICHQAYALLGHHPGIRLLPPLSCATMAKAMLRADLLLSDSGGMQEEAATLGVPMLVLRDKSERMESVESGNAILVGTDTGRILSAVNAFIDQPALRSAMSRPSTPFGDGRAAPRIAEACETWLAEAAAGERRIA